MDECLQAPCIETAECSNFGGSFECNCKPGFDGDGDHCISRIGSIDYSTEHRANQAMISS